MAQKDSVAIVENFWRKIRSTAASLQRPVNQLSLSKRTKAPRFQDAITASSDSTTDGSAFGGTELLGDATGDVSGRSAVAFQIFVALLGSYGSFQLEEEVMRYRYEAGGVCFGAGGSLPSPGIVN